jgi:hypothetical protein
MVNITNTAGEAPRKYTQSLKLLRRSLIADAGAGKHVGKPQDIAAVLIIDVERVSIIYIMQALSYSE